MPKGPRSAPAGNEEDLVAVPRCWGAVFMTQGTTGHWGGGSQAQGLLEPLLSREPSK